VDPCTSQVIATLYRQNAHGGWTAADPTEDYATWTLYLDNAPLQFNEAEGADGSKLAWESEMPYDTLARWESGLTVRARLDDNDGEEPATSTAPGRPEQLQLITAAGAIYAIWYPPTEKKDEIDGYLLQWKPVTAAWNDPTQVHSTLVEPENSVAVAILRDLVQGQRYSVRVKAKSGTETGPPSNERWARAQSTKPWLYQQSVTANGEAIRLSFGSNMEPLAPDQRGLDSLQIRVNDARIQATSLTYSGRRVTIHLKRAIYKGDTVTLRYQPDTAPDAWSLIDTRATTRTPG